MFRLYKDLSWTFQIISPLKHYIDETENFCKLLKKYSQIKINNMLHIGCGFGNNDYIFKKHFNLTGIDKSRSVLKHAKKLNPEVKYHKMDMKKIKLNEKYDSVAAVDSLDYLTTLKDLKLIFTNVYNILNTGGVFFFILGATKESFIQNMTTHFSNKKGNTEITFIENYYDENVNDNFYECMLIFIIKEKSKKIRVEKDLHKCGIFELKDLKNLLKEIGFELIFKEYRHGKEAKEDTDLSGQEYYPMFICVKK